MLQKRATFCCTNMQQVDVDLLQCNKLHVWTGSIATVFDTRPVRRVALKTFGWQRSVVVSALASINVVNGHWARLLLEQVTVCG